MACRVEPAARRVCESAVAVLAVTHPRAGDLPPLETILGGTARVGPCDSKFIGYIAAVIITAGAGGEPPCVGE